MNKIIDYLKINGYQKRIVIIPLKKEATQEEKSIQLFLPIDKN